MITRIKLALAQPEYSALLQMANSQLRDPPAQARYLLREALIHHGLLHETVTPNRERIHTPAKPRAVSERN